MSIEKFILLGHSFGAYIAALYAVRHKEMVEKLILMSPVGMSSSYVSITSTKLEDFSQYLFFKTELTAPTFYKYLGIYRIFFFNNMCSKKKLRGLTNEVRHRQLISILG